MGAFGGIPISSQARTGGAFGGIPVDAPAVSAPVRRDSAMDAISGFLSGAASVIPGVADAVRHPLNALQAGYDAQKSQFEKASKSLNEGNYADALQHLAGGALPILGPMASDFLDSIGDPNTDAHEQARKLGQIVALKALPKVTGKVIEAGKAAAPVVAAGVKAAAPDVAGGAAKLGAGYVASKILPHEAQIALGYPLYEGAKQVGSGLRKGFAAARAEARPPAAGPPPANALPPEDVARLFGDINFEG